MKPEFLDYLEDILDAMNKAEILLQDIDYEQFEDDFRINFAVVRALEIMGEATKRVPETVRQKYDQMPWRQMAGMRDRLIHGYDNINYDIVWEAVKEEIPSLKPILQQIIAENQGQL